MIETRNLTPEVYYKRSRDFQVLGRTIDLVFNYLKNTSDTLSNNILSETFDTALIDLVATTLGFKRIRHYNTNELMAFCSTFSFILRNKGNIQSIEKVIQAIAAAQGIQEEALVDVDINDPYTLIAYLPEKMTNYALLQDVLDYILPAGMSLYIYSTTLIRQPIEDTSYVIKYEIWTTKAEPVIADSQLLQVNNEGVPTSHTKAKFDNGTMIPALDSSIDITRYVNNDDIPKSDQ